MFCFLTGTEILANSPFWLGSRGNGPGGWQGPSETSNCLSSVDNGSAKLALSVLYFSMAMDLTVSFCSVAQAQFGDEVVET